MKVKGYVEMRPGGDFVPVDEALDYVLAKCGLAIIDPDAPDAEEAKEMLVEWFFSGNWVDVYDENELI